MRLLQWMEFVTLARDHISHFLHRTYRIVLGMGVLPTESQGQVTESHGYSDYGQGTYNGGSYSRDTTVEDTVAGTVEGTVESIVEATVQVLIPAAVEDTAAIAVVDILVIDGLMTSENYV
jgi:hypothetical protein